MEELTNLTEDQRADLVNTLESAVGYLENFSNKIETSLGILKCRELQMVSVDIISIFEHLTNLSENGPTPAWAEIPLAQSEVEEI
jgi:hypothetical protein